MTLDKQSYTVNEVVDARGLACPMPLLKAKMALLSLQAQQCLKVMATDQGSVKDFHAFVALTAHELVDFSEADGVYVYVIRKG